MYEANTDRIEGRNRQFYDIVGDFNTPLMTGRPVRQKIYKEKGLNTMSHQNLTDIYRTLYPTTIEYTCFSSAYIGHFPGQNIC